MINKPSSLDDPTVLMLVIIMAILLLVIAMLAHLVTGTASYYYDKVKKEEEKNEKGGTTTAAAIPMMFMVSGTSFYLVTGVIALELLVIFGLLYQLRVFLARDKKAASAVVEHKPSRWKLTWEKLNSFRPAEHEAQIDLGHDYDGIRELDNRLPPWWLYGFYATIVFAAVYLWQHHVSHTAPLSGEEFTIAMAKAEEQKAAYLKKSANNVDENTVRLLTAPDAIAGGKAIYEKNCVPCHGNNAQGIVGPNLTDDYWLHGGSISDIFKTIKYGWVEKGMKSWKDDLSPVQIAQTASYIKTLRGTNPAGAKEKQGELYQDAGNAASAGNKDSIVQKMAMANTGN